MREGIYWEEKEKRRCRVCGVEEETWEHVWERCVGEGIEKGKEAMRRILGGEGEGEKWMRSLEVARGMEREGERE